MLASTYVEGSRKEVIVFSHGFLGDKDQGGMFKVLAEELQKQGFGTLRFDFRGCGQSEDAPIDIEGEVKDLKRMVEFVRSKGKEVVLLGFSLGGLISLLNAESSRAIILIGPVTYPLNIRKRFAERKNYVKVDGGWKVSYKEREYFVDESLVDFLESIERKKLLESIERPVLIIQGDEDEAISVEESLKSAEILGADTYIIKGGKHILNEEQSKEAANAIASFLERKL